jgi:predicted RNA polymerase sigma factor
VADQDRNLWNTTQIEEGIAVLSRTLGKKPLGRYQLQAAIAAVHDEAKSAQDTDWAQILALYDVLEHVSPPPIVTLNRAVAMVNGPQAGLALLETLDTDDRMAHTHRVHAVRGHLLELAADQTAARRAYQQAARMTASLPEQRYLTLRAARLIARNPSERTLVHTTTSGSCGDRFAARLAGGQVGNGCDVTIQTCPSGSAKVPA